MTVTTISSSIEAGEVVTAGNELLVIDSAKTIGAHVSSGGAEVASAGGGAVATIVGSYGDQDISAGGIGNGTIVSGVGANEAVYSGGVTYEAIVRSGGNEDVYSGGLALGAFISSGGTLRLGGNLAGGSSLSATVSSGGSAIVSSGGVASATTVSGGGSITVLSGGAANGLSVASGAVATDNGAINLESGDVDFGISVQGGGHLVVQSGAVTSHAQVLSGYEFVESGGVADESVLSYGGLLILDGGASAVGTTFAGGGEQVGNGYSALDTLVIHGSLTSLIIANSGSAEETFIGSGGVVVISSGGSAQDTFVLSGGIATIEAHGSATRTELIVGGTIDLASLGFVAGGTASLTSATDVLTISQGGTTTTLSLTGDYSGDYFHLTAAADGSTLVTDDGRAACFCHGVLILTDAGERPVQALAVGDHVVTAAGLRRPVVWIGRRSYAGRFLAANPQVNPIRLRAGSLGGGLPRRDLLVSPEHAMLLDGVLVPARCLANNDTIVAERGLDRVDYFHIELASHDIILAEGAPCETFLDDEGRLMFHNAAEHARLHPDAQQHGESCAPRADSGWAIENIRRRLAGRAQVIARAG